MKIGIIGTGVVGSALIEAIKNIHEVIAWDKFKESTHKLSDMYNCDCIFIAVPTPILKSGEIDVSTLYESVAEIVRTGIKNKVLIIKSTAVSGTTDKLAKTFPQFEFAFCPEFLREDTAIEDMLNMNRCIIGAEKEKIYSLVKKVFIEAGFSYDKCKYIFVNRKTAEAIKYASNVYLASKVTFANELYSICKAIDVDYNTVVKAICVDERIDDKYGWKVPGDNGKLGFGKKCFPKDLSAFIYLAKENGYNPYLLMEIWRSNLKFRGEEDWLKISGVYNGDGKLID